METALTKFLVEAKRATYIAETVTFSATAAVPGARQLDYTAANWAYRDIYFGSRRFAGIETVARDGTVVWAMSYSGGVDTDCPVAEIRRVYGALRTALRAMPDARPWRGPGAISVDGLHDCNHSTGTITLFRGHETIGSAGGQLYRAEFSGGMIL